jgi:divalent metal cation (Fe/Co/Zn/Cd) transporter
MHLIVDAADVETAHGITEAVEARLEQLYRPVRVTIHVEPPSYEKDEITYGASH